MQYKMMDEEYVYFAAIFGVFSTLAWYFGNPIAFATTACVGVVNILGLFLSELEFKEQAGKVLATQVSISLLSCSLMHLHEVADWL